MRSSVFNNACVLTTDCTSFREKIRRNIHQVVQQSRVVRSTENTENTKRMLDNQVSRMTCQQHSNIISGCGKIEAHLNWSMVTPEKACTCYWNYLEDYYWPCAGRLSSTGNANPINSGLTRLYMVALNK